MPRRAGVVRAVAVKQLLSWRAARRISPLAPAKADTARQRRRPGIWPQRALRWCRRQGSTQEDGGRGIFIGEGPTPGGNAGGNSGGGGRKRKSKGGNGTAALSARRKVTFSSWSIAGGACPTCFWRLTFDTMDFWWDCIGGLPEVLFHYHCWSRVRPWVRKVTGRFWPRTKSFPWLFHRGYVWSRDGVDRNGDQIHTERPRQYRRCIRYHSEWRDSYP